jgi:hypothetical protein
MQLEEGQCPECKRRTYGRIIYKTGQKINGCAGCARTFDFETGEQIANDAWLETSPGVFERVPEDPIIAKRRVLPQRRNSESFELRHGNHTTHVTLGYFPDGAVGEIFISSTMEMGEKKKVGSELEALWRDLGILFSVARQYGAPIKVLAGALTREQDGAPSTIIGAVADRLAQAEPTKPIAPEKNGG